MELHARSAIDLARMLREGDITPREAALHYLARITAFDAELGAFAEVTAERALRRADALLADDSARGPLWGLPLADKDLVARAGVPTRYGSSLFADHVPEVSDPFARALDDLGAVSLGKTTTPEFGMTGYTESRVSPTARDPWHRSHGAGGSSGGAAVAVAAGLLPVAPGSDAGGSIRIPAATVGIVGLKPSRGRLPVGSGLDRPGGLAVAGPLARTVSDAAFLLDALVAASDYDYATRAPGAGPFLDATRGTGPRRRIGVTMTSPWDDAEDIRVDAAAVSAWRVTADLLAGAGHEVRDADWHPAGYPEMFRTLWRVGAAQLPVRDDQLDRVETITAWLVREGRRMPAQRALAALADATAFERHTISAFAPYDAVLTPAVAQSPRPVGWYDARDAERNFVQQVQYSPFTSFVNVSGLPAITLPVTTTNAWGGEAGHPVSVQLIGRPGGEATLLALAAEIEAARGPLSHPSLDG